MTPRDVIDLLQAARNRQVDLLEQSPQLIDSIMTMPALKYGYASMSERRVNTYLRAEFPHLWEDYLSKFQHQKATLTREAVATLLGTEDPKILKTLEDIGFLRQVPKKKLYAIPYLYRHGMRVTQGTQSS